jgi:hypothetical protein
MTVKDETPPDAVSEIAVIARLSETIPHPLDRQLPAVLRYSGFDQVQNTRLYLFQSFVPGEKKKLIVVSAEMSLFVKHRVRIQDGPTLCLHILKLEMQPVDLPEKEVSRRVVTDEDVTAYLASRPKPEPAKGKREKPAVVIET